MPTPAASFRLRLPRLCGAALLALAAAPGQEPGEAAAPASMAQPTGFDLGSLASDTTVHASFHVRWAAGAAGEAEVAPPPFARVLRVVDRAGERSTVYLSISTREPGGLAGDVTVRRGRAEVAVPIRGVVLPAMPGAVRVLVADAPWEADSATDTSTFEAWRRVVRQGKLEVDYVLAGSGEPVFAIQRLQRARVVLIGEYALTSLAAADAERLCGFVCGGGRLVVAANAFFGDSVGRANGLLQPFGLHMLDEEPAAGTGRIGFAGEALAADPLMAGVLSVQMHRPSPILLESADAVALVRTGRERDPAVLAAVRTPNGGEVIALGQSLWWHWAGFDAANERLLRNLLSR